MKKSNATLLKIHRKNYRMCPPTWCHKGDNCMTISTSRKNTILYSLQPSSPWHVNKWAKWWMPDHKSHDDFSLFPNHYAVGQFEDLLMNVLSVVEVNAGPCLVIYIYYAG